MKVLWEKFEINFSKNRTRMLVIEGDEVHGYPYENCALVKPYNVSFSKEENLMIHRLLKNLSKIDRSTIIITFLASLNIQKH